MSVFDANHELQNHPIWMEILYLLGFTKKNRSCYNRTLMPIVLEWHVQQLWCLVSKYPRTCSQLKSIRVRIVLNLLPEERPCKYSLSPQRVTKCNYENYNFLLKGTFFACPTTSCTCGRVLLPITVSHVDELPPLPRSQPEAEVTSMAWRKQMANTDCVQ